MISAPKKIPESEVRGANQEPIPAKLFDQCPMLNEE